jgi:KaiC/GvpD/RAD55 family RecA-like ATPase
MNKNCLGRIPPCISEFLRAKGGRSLIVKGASGTGKTTFSLQCIENMNLMNSSFFITTRVSDEALYSQFEWLREKEWKERIFDASRGFLKAIMPAMESYDESVRRSTTMDEGLEEDKDKPVDNVIRASKTFLRTVYKDIPTSPMRLERRHLDELQKAVQIPELVQIYERVEMVFPRESLLVLDSVNGLAEKYNLPLSRILHVIQKDLVENTMTKFIVVLEDEGHSDLDYLVDGVVRLTRREIDDRRIREMHIEKLRAVEVHQPKYLITLHGGKFTCIPEFKIRFKEKDRQWEIVKDPEGMFSTGSPDLDKLLGGGFSRGSNVLVDMVDNLPTEAHTLITAPIIANFIKQGRAVMVIPFNEMSSEDYITVGRGIFKGEDAFKLLRVAEKIYFEKAQDKPFIMTLGFEDAVKDWEKWRREAEKLKGETKKPYLEIIALETWEARVGEEGYKAALSLSSEKARKEGDLIIRLSKPGLENLAKRVANHSNAHIKMRRVDGAVVIYGERPHTMICAVDAQTSLEGLVLQLIPIV